MRAKRAIEPEKIVYSIIFIQTFLISKLAIFSCIDVLTDLYSTAEIDGKDIKSIASNITPIRIFLFILCHPLK